MRLALTDVQMGQIRAHCEATYPNEGCGILIGRAQEGIKRAEMVLATGNGRESSAQRNRYSIPPEEILAGELKAEEMGLDVIGYFHSHPDHPARPSEFDREHAWPWYSYLIVSVTQGEALSRRSWQLREDRSGFDEERLVVAAAEIPKGEAE